MRHTRRAWSSLLSALGGWATFVSAPIWGQTMATACSADNGGFFAGMQHAGTMVQCNILWYPCYQPNQSGPSWWILAAPGTSWTSNDMGGLLNLCNGNPYADNWNQSTYTIVDQNGNIQAYPYTNLAQACQGQCNAAQPGNDPFTYEMCQGVVYNDCSDGPSSCSYDSSDPTPCYIAGEQVSGSVPYGVAEGFLHWTVGQQALANGLGQDWTPPVDSTTDEVGDAVGTATDTAESGWEAAITITADVVGL